MTPAQIAARWKTSLHEAGHLHVGRAMAAESRTVQAVVYPIREGGGGAAEVQTTGQSFKNAVESAAGGRAAKLARIYPPPRLAIVEPAAEPQEKSETAPATPASRKPEPETIFDRFRSAKEPPTDACTVAEFCVGAGEEHPREWAKRWRRVHAAARLHVWANREAIRETAIRLFYDGHATLFGKIGPPQTSPSQQSRTHTNQPQRNPTHETDEKQPDPARNSACRNDTRRPHTGRHRSASRNSGNPARHGEASPRGSRRPWPPHVPRSCPAACRAPH